MAEILTYSQALTSLTGGRGDYACISCATRRCRRTSRRRYRRDEEGAGGGQGVAAGRRAAARASCLRRGTWRPAIRLRAERPATLLLPLVLATMASQALLVVLFANDLRDRRRPRRFGRAVGQARSVTAVVAIPVSVVITARIGEIGVPRLLAIGAASVIVACASWLRAEPLGVGVARAHVSSASLSRACSRRLRRRRGLRVGAARTAAGGRLVAGSELARLDRGQPVVGALTQ